jgi:uncharacterized protein (TIGR02301 family)
VRAEVAAAPFDGSLHPRRDPRRAALPAQSLRRQRGRSGATDAGHHRRRAQGERRRQIVARFNRGYRGFEQTYRTCTPAADLAIRRYLDEGAKIARESRRATN